MSPLQPFQPAQQSPWLWNNYNEAVFQRCGVLGCIQYSIQTTHFQFCFLGHSNSKSLQNQNWKWMLWMLYWMASLDASSKPPQCWNTNSQAMAFLGMMNWLHWRISQMWAMSMVDKLLFSLSPEILFPFWPFSFIHLFIHSFIHSLNNLVTFLFAELLDAISCLMDAFVDEGLGIIQKCLDTLSCEENTVQENKDRVCSYQCK